MRILNIAEKPSVARSISSVLSADVVTRRGLHQYCPNICFQHESQMVFTSVLGHLFSVDFERKTRWTDTDPEELFTERIVRQIQPDFVKIKENIEREAGRSDLVIIWTDCDREGENIGRQIKEVVQRVKRMEVKRARFCGITAVEIEHALRNLGEINDAEADAVDARMELDLRIGSAFTRLQTLSLGPCVKEERRIVSFGPCQIPTLGFVVERARERERFVSEMFWTLKILVRRTGRGVDDGEIVENEFRWKRGKVFDRNCVVHFYRRLVGKDVVISMKKVSERIKYRPLPLRTVELQKVCSSYLKLSGHRVMEIAEGLYNKGYISYPRTETDTFGRDFDFRGALSRLVSSSQMGEYARRLVQGFRYPRSGKNDDMAHSPIYPLKGGDGLSGNERDVYEFVCRRFLGALSSDARGLETYYEASVDGEEFVLKGIKVVERNYLEIYHYDRWESKEVSDFSEKEVVCGELCVEDGATTAPGYLTEAELIGLMDRNGIGTDATIHEHVLKIQERGYAVKVGNEIRPLRLGTALIDGYEEFGLEVGRPFLRKNLETNLRRICNREVEKEMVVRGEVEVYRSLYGILRNKMDGFAVILRSGMEEDGKNSRGRTKKGDGKSGGRSEKRSSRCEVERSRKCVSKTQGSSVLCSCGEPARTGSVKNGNNMGKEFYCCHTVPKRCSFFQWICRENQDVVCFCGFEPQLLTSNTCNNKGRRFYKCKKAFKPCKFFQWEDQK